MADLNDRKAVEGLVRMVDKFSSLWFLNWDFSVLTALLREFLASFSLSLAAWRPAGEGLETEISWRFLKALWTTFSSFLTVGLVLGF